MRLYWSSRSPYVRKVMVAAHELGLADRIDCIPTVVSLRTSDPLPDASNPLGQIPTLLTEAGEAIHDSTVIAEYLALLAGDETAVGLGVNVQRFRLQLFTLTSLLVGVVVAVSGAIGFVGLMIPHLVRMVVGSDHRRVLPTVAVGGGLYLVLVDLVGRTIMAPQELPVGIVTAALGGPFFLWLLRRRKG